MREYLVFLLSAPIASFGSYAGHERRGSETVPMRSAVLGLLGAALGIKRTDATGQSALRAYSIAVQSFRDSTPLRDYHTVQTIPTAKVKRPATRRQAVLSAGDDINTVITIRDYRCDVLVGVAVWGKGKWTFDDFCNGLRFPRFPIYLGRKSCPLANPLNPRVVQQANPMQALASLDIPEWLCSERQSELDRNRFLVYSDPIDGFEQPPYSEVVPGEPIDREQWTFGERELWHLPSDEPEGSR